MTTKATTTRAVQVQRGQADGPPETFVKIAEVTTFKGPSSKAPQLDATSFDSTAMEFVAGLVDNGEFTFDCNIIGTDAQQQGLRTDMNNGTKRNFKLVLNDMPVGGSNPTSVLMSAIVTQAPEFGGAVNQVVKGSATLKISGQPTVTWAV